MQFIVLHFPMRNSCKTLEHFWRAREREVNFRTMHFLILEKEIKKKTSAFYEAYACQAICV